MAFCVAAGLLLGCAACSTDMRKFFVSSPSQSGVLLAPDLATLNAVMAADSARPITAIPLPNGTKGLALERKFLRGGRLIDTYPANTFDMERDGAVEVVLFEVAEGPKRWSRGWVQASFLRPDFSYL